MEFSPFNPIIKLCLQGMAMEDKGEPGQAANYFRQAWQQATSDFEKFLAAHYLARVQESVSDRLNWLETALQFALRANNHAANSALPALYANLASCYQQLGRHEEAETHAALALTHKQNPSDKGPFYLGTKASLQTGDLLVPGGTSNYQAALKMNHIYFTALVNGAGLAAALAAGSGPERVYEVEPTGPFEHDPNLTDKKFPGNPSRSYRSEAPLKIIGEVTDWVRPAPEELQRFRERVASNPGEIIN